jgi:hypothetical protein
MAGIVRELQKEALDKSVRVSDLLRKALLVARKLKVPEMEAWITSELNGYPKDATFPDYRIVTGQIRARNPITGAWLPVMFPENAREDILDSLTRRQSNQSISEIESMVSDPDGDSMFAMPFSNRVQARLMKGTAMDSPPVLIVQVASLHGIVDAVRTAILDWALKLEEKGILGKIFPSPRQTAARLRTSRSTSLPCRTRRSRPIPRTRSKSSRTVRSIPPRYWSSWGRRELT